MVYFVYFCTQITNRHKRIMKKNLLLIMLLTAHWSAAMADDYTYPYLVFVNGEGAQTTVSVNELEITFSNGQLVAKNSDGTTSVDLATLTMMQFTETGTVSPVTPARTESGLAFAEGSATVTATLGEAFTEPVLENPNALTLVWTSSDESVATVDESGKVTLVGAGTVTITATFAGNDEYEAGAASYTLMVSEAETDALRNVSTPTTLNVYTASGIFLGTFDSVQQAKATLKRGLYVIKSNDKTHKLNIR